MATNLTTGDVSILGFNADSNFVGDDWSFLTNVWIEAGTTINFTDRGWTGSGFGGDPTYDLTVTWTATTDIAPGTVINFNSSAGSFSGDSFLDLWTAGDQIIAYTGTNNIINAIHSRRDFWDANANNEINSALPTGLTDGADALALGDPGSTAIGLVYSGITTGTVAELRAAWQNPANWTTDIGTGTQISTSFTVTATGLSGTAGDDVLTTDADPLERITDQHAYNGLAGHDAVDYSAAINPVVVDLTDATGLSNEHAAYGDTYTSIEEFRLTGFADTFTGTVNDETVKAGAGVDTIDTGDGDDTLDGGGGADVLNGGTGYDTVEHLTAASAVTVDLTDPSGASNAGDALGDTYSSIELWRLSNHDDTFIGDAGDNKVQGDAGRDSLNGGGGTDTASYANAPSFVTVDLTDASGNSNVGDALGDTFISIEEFELSPHDDFFYGDALNNKVYGLDGIDTLDGGLGIDILVGGAGADILIGGGGPGDFASYETSTSGLVVDLATPGNNTGDAAGDSYTDVNHLIGSDHNDTLRGNSGFNLLKGGAGNDTLEGGGFSDLLSGGVGADVIDGGSGTDTATYYEATSAVTADLANSAANTGEAAGDTYISIERLQGSDFSDTLAGDSGANKIVGGQGDDVIEGRGGNDTLYGDGFGATGADDFLFNSVDIGDGADVIRDFLNDVDEIVFENITSGEISHTDIGSNVELTYTPTGATVTVTGINWADLSDDISYI